MKRIFYAIGLALLLVSAGCVKKEEVDARFEELEARIARLEDLVAQLNSQVVTISTLLDGKYFVQSVTDLADGAGYQLVLVDKDGNTVVKTVKNGVDGEDGSTPEVSVRMDSDGNYYWTVNGEWMLVDGQRVRANGLDGADGKTPEFKVEDGKWYVRLGDGSWTYVGPAVTEAKSLITAIDTTSKEDVMIIQNGRMHMMQNRVTRM